MRRISRREGLLLAVAVLAVAAASAPRFGNGFIWDDHFLVVEGEVIHDPSRIWEAVSGRTHAVSAGYARDRFDSLDLYRPVPVLTFFLDSALWGKNPAGYQLTSLLLHLGCVVLVFFLVRRMLPPQRSGIAPFVAAWFGLTPLLGEAHLWVAARYDVVCAFLALSAILMWRRSLQPEGRRPVLFIASALVFLLGLLSKEVLVMSLPALVLFPSEPGTSRHLRTKLVDASGFAIAAAVALGIRHTVLQGLRTHAAPEQITMALERVPALLADGFVELVVPTRVYVRAMLYDYRDLPGWWLVGVATLLLGVAAALLLGRRRVPLLAWSFLWVASILAPAALIATMPWPGFGRYLYLPAAGLSLGIAEVAAGLLERIPLARTRRLLVLAGTVWLGALGVRLHLWSYDFRTDETLWKSAIGSAPDRAHGYGWLGFSRVRKGRYHAAIEPLISARQLDPTEDRYVEQLAWAMHMTGDLEGSLRVALDGLRRFPSNPELHYVAARSLMQSRPRLAARHLIACLRAQPHHPTCREAVRILSGTPPFPELLAAEVADSDPRVRALVRPLLDGS